MAGIINSQMTNQNPDAEEDAQQNQPPQQAEGAPPDVNVDQTSNAIMQALQVTPDQQAQYKRLVMGGMQVIYGDSTHEQVAKMLKSGAQDPPATLARAGVMIVSELLKIAKPAPQPEILMPAGAEIIVLLAELAGRAHFFPISVPIIAAAFQQGIQLMAQTVNLPPQLVQKLEQQCDPRNMMAVIQQIQQQSGQQQAQPQQSADPDQDSDNDQPQGLISSQMPRQ